MKSIIASILVAILLIVLAWSAKSNSSLDVDEKSFNNVSIVEGKQIIEIRAKGGYSPKKSIAKAGVPTIIRFNGVGTFDCSLAIRIPKLDITQTLSPSNFTDVDIGINKVGVLNGLCAMGMYNFEIEFVE